MKRTIRKLKFKLKRRRAGVGSVFYSSGRRRVNFRNLGKFSWHDVKKFVLSKNFLKFAGLSALSLAGLMMALFGYFAKDLPDPNKINAREIEQTTKILDRKGRKLYDVYGDVKRTLISFDDIPQNCKNAVIVKEDKDFYKHHGFVPRSLARALKSNALRLVGRGKVEGGSTITQQMVKNVLLSPERTITRKIKEVILAVEIEQLYKKDDIFRIYLNEIPYGTNAYGIEAAANTYFGKRASQLNLEECAVLAALPQAPTYYSPYGENKGELLVQKDFVLDEMTKEGYISKTDAEKAKAAKLIFSRPRESILAPHFVLHVRQQLVEKYGEKLVLEGGLRVTTTLDLNLHRLGEKIIRQNNGNMSANGANNASLVSIDPKTGQVLVMIGSKDYFNEKIDGNVNVARSLQQPGSSLKPIVYGIMFAQPDRWGRTWGPGSVLYDVSTDFGGAPAFRPKNYDGRAHGIVTVRRALGNSYNIPAAKALYIAGIDETVKQLKELGYTSKTISADRCGLSLVLGGCEVTLLDHTSAYATVANMGVRHEPTFILKVEDANGKVLEEWKKPKGQEILDEQVAYLVGDMISDTSARTPTFGSNTFNVGRRAAAKTGTTDDYRDAWTMGFIPQLATGVWVGNNNNKALKRGGAGSMVAEPVWRGFMKEAVKKYPKSWLTKPKGIKKVKIDSVTGAKPDAGTSKSHSDIFPEWFEPMTPPNGSKTYITDKVSGRLADLTPCGNGTAREGEPRTPSSAQGKIYTGRIQAEIPSKDLAYPRWQSALGRLGGGSSKKIPTTSDNVHSCADIEPAVDSISLSKSGSQIKITANVDEGTFNLTKVQFYVDGVYKGQLASGSCITSGSCELLVDNPGGGSHTYRVAAIDAGLYTGSGEESKDTAIIL